MVTLPSFRSEPTRVGKSPPVAVAYALICYMTVAPFGCKACSVTNEDVASGAPPAAQEPDASQPLSVAMDADTIAMDADTTHDFTELSGCEALESMVDMVAMFRRRPWEYYPPGNAVFCERGICSQSRAEEIGLLGVGWTETRPAGSHFFVRWWEPTNFRCDSLGFETARTDPKTDRCEKIPRGPLAGMTVAFDHRGLCMMIFDEAYDRADPAAATPFNCDNGNKRATGALVHCPNVSLTAARRLHVK